MASEAWCRTTREGTGWVVRVGGSWTLATAAELERTLARLALPESGPADLDLSELTALDTAGAFLLHRVLSRMEHDGLAVRTVGAQPMHKLLLERVTPPADRRSLARPDVSPLRALVERIGRASLDIATEAYDLINFFGLTSVTLLRVISRPARIRFIALSSHLEQVGLYALPIVGLLSFLIGVVLAYQGADQLRAFGAEIYSVNLLGVSVLREIGVLLTAILVAGRSGSAFTAEIGTMKVNEEVDAMKTLGLDVMEVLVIPRLLAVIIALPLLTFFADIAGLAGGALMSVTALGLSLPQFFEQLRTAVSAHTFWIGFVKAPFFALLIGLVGCYEGLKVHGGAESVGRMTTKSVVESIFLVIIADAAFSIVFSWLRL